MIFYKQFKKTPTSASLSYFRKREPTEQMFAQTDEIFHVGNGWRQVRADEDARVVGSYFKVRTPISSTVYEKLVELDTAQREAYYGY